MSSHGTNTKVNEDEGFSRTSVAFGLGFLILLSAIIGLWIVQSDRLNGLDSWRTLELMKQRDGLKAECDEGYEKLGSLQEWVRQQKPVLSPDPKLMVGKPCRPITSVEKPQDPKEQK